PLAWNPRRSPTATATASPKPSTAAVEAAGASPKEQASCATEQSKATSAAEPKVEMPDSLLDVGAPLFAIFEGWESRPPRSKQISSPVIEINGTCNRLIVASNARISSVSPLAERASTTSPRTTIPRSPCKASTGCKYSDGVPVELKVAAILRAIKPLFPIPVTTTRPAQQNIRSTAF